MAEIPLGNFGVRGADPAQRSQVNTEGFDAVNVALNRAAGAGMAIAGEALDEQKRQQRAMKQVEAANAIGQAQLKTETVKQQIMQDMREGKLSHEQADKAYQEAIQAVEMPKVEGLDPVMQAQFDGQIGQLGQRGRIDLMPHIEQAKIGKFQSDIDGILDAQSKRAGLPGADIEGINAGIDAMEEQGRMAYGDKWEAKKRDFIEGNYQNHVQQRLLEAGDNLSELRAIEHDLAASDGYYAEKIDAGKRLGLQNNISNNISRIEQHNEMLATKREVRAMNVLQDIERQNASGIPPTPDMIDNWKTIGSGTAAAGNIEAKIEQGQQIQQFLKVPIDQQQATIQQMESNLTTNGGSVQDKTNLDSLRRVFDANKKTLTESPLVYSQERLGAKIEPLDFNAVMQPDDGGKLFSNLRDRMETVTALQQKHGAEVKPTLLLPQEADALKAQVAKMPPDQQRQFFGGLNKASGGGKEYKAIMQQIAPDEPVTAFAGMLASKQESTVIERNFFSPDTKTASKDVSALMLQGNAIIKDKDAKFPLPKDADFAAQFDQFAGGAFANAPKAYQTGMQSVKAYYAGRAAQDGDVSGMVDPKLMRESINAVLGAPVEHNGKTVLAPWGMDEDTFTSKAEASYQQLGLSVDFDNINLVPAGDGRYGITSGRAPILKDGRPVYIEVR